MKVLVVAGTSGGHIFPALSFLDALKDRHKQVDALLVLPSPSRDREGFPDADIISQIKTSGYKIHYISVATLKLNIDFKNYIAVLKFFKSSLESLSLVLGFKPDVVVGFGSLLSVPIVLFAWLFRIRNLVHEQNIIPGKANRILAKFADRVAISFRETRDYLTGDPDKISLTGNPIRRGLKRFDKNKALDFFELSRDKFTILVMGGSAGSHSINISFLNTLLMLKDRSRLQFIHLAGLRDYDLLKSSYQNFNINFRLFSFLKEMQYAYNACDLVVSRAGATTITEIIFFGLPAIIVPYPFAYKHQLSNAKVLESNGCAIIIEDNKLSNNVLRQTIEEFIDNPDKLKDMRYKYANITKFQADDLLVDEVLALV